MVGWLDCWIALGRLSLKKSVKQEGKPFIDIALWLSLEDKLNAINNHKYGKKISETK